MVTHPYLESAFARKRLARPAGPGGPAAPGSPGPQPRQGVSAGSTAQSADGPFPQAQPPGSARVINHTAADSSHSRKGEPPWPP